MAISPDFGIKPASTANGNFVTIIDKEITNMIEELRGFPSAARLNNKCDITVDISVVIFGSGISVNINMLAQAVEWPSLGAWPNNLPSSSNTRTVMWGFVSDDAIKDALDQLQGMTSIRRDSYLITSVNMQIGEYAGSPMYKNIYAPSDTFSDAALSEPKKEEKSKPVIFGFGKRILDV